MKSIFSKRMILGVLMSFAVVGCSSDDDTPNDNRSLSDKDKIILNNTLITGGGTLSNSAGIGVFKGKIKKVKSTSYDAVIEGGKVVKKGKSETYEEYFSEKGRRIGVKAFDIEGKLTRDVKYIYDEKGGLIREIEKEGGRVGEKIVENKYDSKDRCIEKKTTYTTGSGVGISVEKFVYNHENNVIEHLFSDENDNFSLKYTFIYDDNGNKIKESQYSPEDGKEVFRGGIKYEYNEDNQVVKQEEFNEKEEVESIRTNEYKNGWIKEVKYVRDGKTEIYKYDIILDEKNNPKQVVTQEGDKIEDFVEISYEFY